MAARAVLEIVKNFPQNDDQIPSTSSSVSTITKNKLPEKPLATYRQQKNAGIKPIQILVRNRHNYFLRLPLEWRNAAKEILLDKSDNYGTSRDKVRLTCEALHLEYQIDEIPNHPLKYRIFHLIETEHDCVIADTEPELYDRVLEHFRIMLNLTKS